TDAATGTGDGTGPWRANELNPRLRLIDHQQRFERVAIAGSAGDAGVQKYLNIKHRHRLALGRGYSARATQDEIAHFLGQTFPSNSGRTGSRIALKWRRRLRDEGARSAQYCYCYGRSERFIEVLPTHTRSNRL